MPWLSLAERTIMSARKAASGKITRSFPGDPTTAIVCIRRNNPDRLILETSPFRSMSHILKPAGNLHQWIYLRKLWFSP